MASNGSAPVGISKNINQIGRTDLPGGGSIVVENGYAYVGHIDPPHGTSILDVHDAKHPKLIAQLEVPEGIHSHKVRVSGDIMLINYERYKTKKEPDAGLKIFDISDRSKPREIALRREEKAECTAMEERPCRHGGGRINADGTHPNARRGATAVTPRKT